jgi:hypothetical protein
MVAFAKFETDPAGEIVMINVEKIVLAFLERSCTTTSTLVTETF